MKVALDMSKNDLEAWVGFVAWKAWHQYAMNFLSDHLIAKFTDVC